MESKVCGRCKVEKSENLFYKEKSSSDGHQSRCKDCSKVTYKTYRETNLDRVRENDRKRYRDNPERAKISTTAWRLSNKDKIKGYDKSRNKHDINLRVKLRKETDINYRLAANLRSRTANAIRYAQKSGSAISDLGCTVEALRIYLQERFEPGMNWHNWGRKGWHIDHIVPLSKFDLSERKQFLKAVHYTNLQPLWWEHNISKSNR